MHNLKTNITGIVAIAAAVGHLLSHLTTGDTTMATIWGDLAALAAGAGLLFAEDAKK